MINFWASWCGPCRQEFPALDEMYRKYKPMGFAMVGINVESEKADAEHFLGATPGQLPDPVRPRQPRERQLRRQRHADHGAGRPPGPLRWQHRAYKAGDEAEYIEQIRAMLREPS